MVMAVVINGQLIYIIGFSSLQNRIFGAYLVDCRGKTVVKSTNFVRILKNFFKTV